MNTQIRQADVRDTERVSNVLIEAADWLRERGVPMWSVDELAPDRITSDVARGDFFVAESCDEITGTVKFQLQDDLF